MFPGGRVDNIRRAVMNKLGSESSQKNVLLFEYRRWLEAMAGSNGTACREEGNVEY